MNDINTLRVKHKLRLNILKRSEVVYCTGEPERFEILRFFWKHVDCRRCLNLREHTGIKKNIKALFLGR